MKKDIVKNFIFNSLLKLSSIVFPLLTIPYTARIFSVEIVGDISFIQSLVGYFISFSSLGLPIYGVREIAKVKYNKKRLNKLLIELIFFNLLVSIIFVIVILLLLQFNLKLIGVKKMLIIYLLNLLVSPFVIDWYYEGIEAYNIITKRSLAIRIFSLICLYLFIKNDGDIDKYIVILTLPNILIAIYNMGYIAKNFQVYIPKIGKIKKYIKDMSYSFLLLISILVFSTLDIVILGLYSTEKDVAYYSIASKVVRLSLTLILAYGGILIPKITRSLEEKNYDTYKELTKSSLSFSLILMIPSFLGFMFFSKEILDLLFGSKYINASILLKILSLLIIFVTISNFCGIQILYPNKQDKIVLKTVMIGALLNIVFNLLFVNKYGAIGVSVATVLADFIIATLQLYYSLKFIEFKLCEVKIIRYILISLVLCLISKYSFINNFLKIFFYGVTYLAFVIFLEMKTLKKIYYGEKKYEK